METEQLPFDKEFIHWLYVGHHPFVMYPDVDGNISFTDEVNPTIYTIEDMYEIYLAHKDDDELYERFYSKRHYFFWRKFSTAFREKYNYNENMWSRTIVDALSAGQNPYRIIEYLIQAITESQKQVEHYIMRNPIPMSIEATEHESDIITKELIKKRREDKKRRNDINKPNGIKDN